MPCGGALGPLSFLWHCLPGFLIERRYLQKRQPYSNALVLNMNVTGRAHLDGSDFRNARHRTKWVRAGSLRSLSWVGLKKPRPVISWGRRRITLQQTSPQAIRTLQAGCSAQQCALVFEHDGAGVPARYPKFCTRARVLGRDLRFRCDVAGGQY